MSSACFACPTCRTYIPAGFSWARIMLEDRGIVGRDRRVDVRTVLRQDEFWNPGTDERSCYLYKPLLNLRRFLFDHEAHGVVYTGEDIFLSEDSSFRDWKRIDL